MTSMPLAVGGWERKSWAKAMPMAPVLLVALFGVFAISLPNLRDPMLQYDDFPALLAQPSWFWSKTLHEGRWLNYLWHLRGFVTPAWLNFAVYQILWAVLAAALATGETGLTRGRTEERWFTCVLALFIIVAPPATMIALWYNTLIPGLAIVALYAVLGVWMPQRWHRALLLPFTVVTFMAYTTYPMILLAVCLFRTEDRSVRDLAGLLALFVVSFAAAVLVTYTINWQVHGVFGVPLDAWREATPAHDLAGLVANLPMLKGTFSMLLDAISYDFEPLVGLHLIILLVATVYLGRLAPKEALYLHAGLWIGVALIAVQVLKFGTPTPPRSFAFAWIFYAAIVIRATALLSSDAGLPGRIGRNVSLLIVAGFMFLTFDQFTVYRGWQAETRALAAAVAQADGSVVVHGDVMEVTSGVQAGVVDELALFFRIEYLTGERIVLCRNDPDACAAAEQAQTFRVDIADMVGEKRFVYNVR